MKKEINFSNLDSVLNNVATTAKGNSGKKQSLYNEETFLHYAKKYFPNNFDGEKIKISLYEKTMKATRKKIRTLLFAFLESIEKANKAGNKNLLSESAKNFATFYNATYQINDYSVNSVASANMNNDNLQFIAKVLPIAQKAIAIKKEKPQKPQKENIEKIEPNKA